MASASHICSLFVVVLLQVTLFQGSAMASRKLAALVEPQPTTLTYHKGHLLTGSIAINLVWYGKFTPAQRAIVADFVSSLSSPIAASAKQQPSVASWWKTAESYYALSNSPLPVLSLGKQVLDESYSLGRSLTSDQLRATNEAAEPDLDDSLMGAPKNNALVSSIDDMQVDVIKVNCKHQSVFPVPELNDRLHNSHTFEPDPDDGLNNKLTFETDPDVGLNNQLTFEYYPDDCLNNQLTFEPDPDDSLAGRNVNPHGECEPDDYYYSSEGRSREEPDPDDSEAYRIGQRQGEIPGDMQNMSSATQMKYVQDEMRDIEPDPDDSEVKSISVERNDSLECNPHGLGKGGSMRVEPETDKCTDELNNEELHRIEEPVAVMCERLQKAVEMLRSEAPPFEASSSLQTLIKIIRNVIDHPDETKFRRLRKANPLFQRNVANFKAAMEVLTVIGFCEDVVADEFGRMETYLVLRRNDPGLLWLAKSSLEVSTT